MKQRSLYDIYGNLYLGTLEIILRTLLSGMTFRLPVIVLLDVSLTVKAAPHECVIRTSQP